MKRYIAFFIAFIIIMSYFSLSVSALTDGSLSEIPSALRAGGGGGGGSGSGSGGGGSSSSHNHTSTNNSENSNPLHDIIGFIVFIFLASSATIIFRIKLSKRVRNTKKLMKLLVKKDSAWKYKNIQKTVRNAYFIIQKAWSNSDMRPAKAYMSNELYESFNTKLSWMTYRNEQNVLKNIKLKEAIPVAVHDNEDDSLDYVWFYIKGRMIDYKIDTQTKQKIDGNTFPTSFSEYWQFTRTESNEWVLNAILQKDESDQIQFNE